MRKLKILFVVFLAVLIFVPSVWASETVPGDVLVVFKAEPGMTVTRESLEEGGDDFIRVTSIAEDLDARIVEIYPALSKLKNVVFALLHSDVKSEDVLIEELLALPDVLSASPNHISSSMSAWYEPDDPYYLAEDRGFIYKQWGLKAVRAPEAWKITSGDPNVYVAVIDSGIDFTHVDLMNNFDYTFSQNFYAENYAQAVSLENARNFLDYNGHGTHVAGIISARGNNGTGVTGVSWNSKLISLRASGKDNKTNDLLFLDDNITQALEYIAEMIENPKFADKTLIVNISMGGYKSKTPEKMQKDNDPQWLALSALSGTDRVLFCVAACNENIDIGLPAPEDSDKFKKGQYPYPAAYRGIDNMIVVANAEYKDLETGEHYVRNGAKFPNTYIGSNYSTKYVHIAAPGTDIWSTFSRQHHVSYDSDPISHDENGNYYARIGGTSMAAPFVAGAAALLLSKYPDATASRLRDAIFKGANTYYAKDYTKYGFLNIDGAFKYMRGESVPVGVPVDDFNFPDDNFCAYVSEKIDTDRNGYLNSQEIGAVTSINASGRHIADLTGIEIFEALQTLDMSNNDLKSFYLEINNKEKNKNLTEINFSNCVRLNSIALRERENLQTVNLEGCSALNEVTIDSNKNLKTLKLKGCSSITDLTCEDCALTALDLSGLSALTALNCGGNKIRELNLSGCPLLKNLYCQENSLAALDLSACPLLTAENINLSSQDCYGMTIQKKSEGLYTIDFNDFIPKKDSILTGSIHVYSYDGIELTSLTPTYDSKTGILTLSRNNPSIFEPAKISYRYITSDKIPPYAGNDTPFFMDVIMKEESYSTPDTDSPVVIDEAHFPDERFRTYIKNNIDKNHDGILSVEEITACKVIRIYAKSLKGIEYFTSLTTLECIGYMLTELDVSKNTALITLKCSYNYLTKLDVSGCEVLETLECFRNNLRELDVSGNPTLTSLNCSSNQLTGLDVSGNPALTELICAANPLRELDVSGCKTLEYLNCSSNQLTELDVSGCKTLEYLSCSSNQLTELDVSKNTALIRLWCDTNRLRELDVRKNTALETLHCYSNQLTKLILGNNSLLNDLDCRYNPKLREPDTTGCPRLRHFTHDKFYVGGDETPPVITKSNLPIALTGKNYNAKLSAQSDSSVTWSARRLPDGLTIAPETGVISGTPTKAKTSTFTVTAKNEFGETSETFTISVYELPSITTASVKEGTVNKTYNSKFKANGSKPITWSAKGLPNGLSINPDNGTISGATSAFGTFPLTITATNPAGSDEAKVNLIIHAIPPKISGKFAAGFLSEPYSSTITLSKGTEPIEWTLEGDLPEGLSFDKRTATLSGIPAQTWNGSVTITASNDAGVAQKAMSLKIKGTSPKISGKFEKGNLNEPYSSALTLSKGTLPVNFSFEGTLPNGLNFNPDTLTLSGTPSELWNDYITVTVSNGAGSYSKAFKIQIKGTAPKIVTSGLPVGNVNSNYSVELEATGSNPITWTAENLPEGLSLNGNKIEGVPSEECRNLKITVRASNPVKTVSKTFRLTVNEAVVEETSSPAPSEIAPEEISDKSEEIKPEENILEEKIIFGEQRDASSINLTVLNLSEDYEIAAVLPEIHVTESGMYEINVELDENVEDGRELIWLACVKNSEPSDDDKIAEFYDEEGNEITEVPKNHKITVSAWFNGGVIYEPVIAVKFK